jgi:hypothetical protein
MTSRISNQTHCKTIGTAQRYSEENEWLPGFVPVLRFRQTQQAISVTLNTTKSCCFSCHGCVQGITVTEPLAGAPLFKSHLYYF